MSGAIVPIRRADRLFDILRILEIGRDLGLIGGPATGDLGPWRLARLPAQPEPVSLIGSA